MTFQKSDIFSRDFFTYLNTFSRDFFEIEIFFKGFFRRDKSVQKNNRDILSEFRIFAASLSGTTSLSSIFKLRDAVRDNDAIIN